MSRLVESILGVSPAIVFLVVGLLVFAEDALFVGFVVPGETAAILGGVDASRGHVALVPMMALVVAAAIVGDTVGYEVGRTLGTRLLATRWLDRHRGRLDGARAMLKRRGGSAVFLGRFVAFFRAVMPALAGTSRMPYLRFLAFNAAGGLAWGIGAVVVGYLAGNSYRTVEKTVGRGSALVVLGIVIIAYVVFRFRRRRARTVGDRR